MDDTDEVVVRFKPSPSHMEMELFDTPSSEAPMVLRQLRNGITPLMATAALETDEAQVKRAHSVKYLREAQYQAAVDGRSSTVGANTVTDYEMEESAKLDRDLDQYQKHVYTPRSTRSMTQPNRSYDIEEDLEEEPMTEAAFSVEEPDMPRIQAFAKLLFDDGEFFMNTYSVELGRDRSFARYAFRKKKRASSGSDIAHDQKRQKMEHNPSHPGSMVSESGGVIAVDHLDEQSSVGYHGKKATSTSSSSQQMSRKSSMLLTPHQTNYQSLAMASLMGTDALYDYEGANPPVPSPDSCPLIPIHPPTKVQSPLDVLNGVPREVAISNYKAISRKHAKIAYNFEKNLFEVHVFGRNGAYVDGEICHPGDVQQLTNGSIMQIGGVIVKFMLPDAGAGQTGAEINEDSHYASGVSLESEERSYASTSEGGQGDRDGISQDEEDSETGKTSQERSPELKPPPKAKAKVKAAPQGGKAAKSGKTIAQAEGQNPLPKRKGPGRPPKNGVMSKREMGLLAKQAKEDAKATAQGNPAGESAPGKGKSRKRDDKKPQEAQTTQPNGKRKYTKRKDKINIIADLQETRESTEHTESLIPEQLVPPKLPKEKKPPKPPRSPSPFIDRASLTAEQLTKPQQSYVHLIHEALTESEKGPMSLNQIYRAISHKYPYFKFVVETVGWQSSVRHNLLQNAAFRKEQRDGKGYLWGLEPGVSIEKEKKRRPTSPQTQSPYYPPPHNMPYQHGYYHGMPPPPNGQAPYHPHYVPPPPNAQPGMPQKYRSYPPAFYPPPSRPNGIPLPLINLSTDNSSTYQSPYATDSQQVNDQQQSPYATDSQHVNGQQQCSTQQTGPNGDCDTKTPASPYASGGASDQQPHPNPQQPHTGPSPPQPPDMAPEARLAVARFRDVLMGSMADKDFGELLIKSATNRVFGSQQFSSLPGRGRGLPEDKQEIMVMNALRTVTDGPPKGTSEANGGGSGREIAVKTEQLPGAGRLTPGTVAIRLVDETGVIRRSVEAEERRASAATEAGYGSQDVSRLFMVSAAATGELGSVGEPSASDVQNAPRTAEGAVATNQVAV